MIALVVSVPAGDAELASDALWALGVLAVEEREPAGAIAGALDHVIELWTSLGDDVDDIAGQLAALPARWRWRFVEVDDAVVDTWRQHATATWVSADVVVHPAWIALDVPATTIAIAIEPGVTFGLGDHPTTVLTMRAMREAIFHDATVLDVGCGSGVLSVAACRFGAARVEAIDISPAAVPTTLENARRNSVEQRITVTTTPLEAVDGQFDVVVANILAPALIALAADLRRVLAPGGVLVISGILADRHDHVLEALAPLRVVGTHERDGWVAISLRW